MIEGLDGSVELIDIELDIDCIPLPPKNDKIALIDADTVAFTACLNIEEEVDVLSEEFHTPEEWQEIISDPSYNAEEGIMYITNEDELLVKAEEKIQRILDKTGCKTCELHFTGGRGNFRYEVYPLYKDNRKNNRAPVGLKWLKNELLKKYPGTISEKWEADDQVCYLMRENPEKYTLVALDKDCINSVPGRNFNYYESRHYNIEMKWVDVTEKQARMWPYLQTILGDKTDNVPGCVGIGPAKAKKFINEDMTEEELWAGVVRAWESKGGTSVDALISMNLVNMHLLHKVDGELKIVKWLP